MSSQLKHVEDRIAGLDDKFDRLFAMLDAGGGGATDRKKKN